MTCLILEDNPIARDIVIKLIDQVENLTLSAVCGTAEEALIFFQHNTVDLILLDIEMPGLSGFEFLRQLKKRPLVIIISGHEKYAVYGYEFNVADYLVKPVQPQRFEQAIEKVAGLLSTKSQDWGIQNKDFVFIKDSKVLQKINFNEILWLEAQGDYVKLNTTQRTYMVHNTLKSIEDKLPPQFVRVHRSYLISLDKADRIEENIIYVKNKSIPVSDTYWKNLKDSLNIL